jgi:hypothetical protein
LFIPDIFDFTCWMHPVYRLRPFLSGEFPMYYQILKLSMRPPLVVMIYNYVYNVCTLRHLEIPVYPDKNKRINISLIQLSCQTFVDFDLTLINIIKLMSRFRLLQLLSNAFFFASNLQICTVILLRIIYDQPHTKVMHVSHRCADSTFNCTNRPDG